MAKGKKRSRKNCCTALLTLKKTARMCFNKSGKASVVSQKTVRKSPRHVGKCVTAPHMATYGKSGERCVCETAKGSRRLLKTRKCK